MLAFRNSPLGQGLCLVLAFLLEEEALGLNQLDLEDAVVADVSYLPETGGVRHAHDTHEVLLIHDVDDLEVPVVRVGVAQRANYVGGRPAGIIGAPDVLDGVG